jgi:IS30 family transposase
MRRPNFPYNDAERAELWRLWREGQSIKTIAVRLNRSDRGLGYALHEYGGIRPAPRTRALSRLTLAQREEISRGISRGLSLRSIASHIGKSPSTVSREVSRNCGQRAYRAARAEQAAWDRARRPKRCLLRGNQRLRRCVTRGLLQCWSPQQISRRLEQRYPHDQSMRVSHETIYRTLFIQARGALKKQLTQHLRTGRTLRHPRAKSRRPSYSRIVDAVSISERPAQAEDRAVPGHWEGDLISGSGNTHIATLVERHSRFVLLAKLRSKETNDVVAALTRKMSKLPTQLRRSLTWDRGTEMAGHQRFTIATDIQVYFCDPQSPWQRGSNENTNGLLRQYFPKGTDLSVHSQAKLDAVARQLNGRPRETLKFKTPAEKLSESVAQTG